jgi:hypothetical protein
VPLVKKEDGTKVIRCVNGCAADMGLCVDNKDEGDSYMLLCDTKKSKGQKWLKLYVFACVECGYFEMYRKP